MLIVDRLNRAADYDHAVRGYRACGFKDRRRLRTGLSDRAQTEDTSHCEQKYALQDSSYRHFLPYCVGLSFLFRSVTSRLRQADSLMSHAELIKGVEEAEYLEKPQNDDDYNDAIQDTLDLTLHGDETVNQP